MTEGPDTNPSVQLFGPAPLGRGRTLCTLLPLEAASLAGAAEGAEGGASARTTTAARRDKGAAAGRAAAACSVRRTEPFRARWPLRSCMMRGLGQRGCPLFSRLSRLATGRSGAV